MTDRFHPLSRGEWRDWLEKNHTRASGVWLVTYKKATGKPRVEYDEAVEEALCFGWIDSKPAKLDEERSMLWFAPRKARSVWSKLNKQRVARLKRAGLMTAAGQAKINAAKRDGSWSILDEVEELRMPADLAAAFEGEAEALGNFEQFAPSTRKGIMSWIVIAKGAETRAARIAKTVEMARRGLRANYDRE